MAARRRYTWLWRAEGQPSGYSPQEVALAADEFLAESCAAWPQFYTDPQVRRLPDGNITIGLTVSAKDQWKIRWRVRNKLLPLLGLAIKVYPARLDLVENAKLPPHSHPNRGLRWRAPQN